MVDPWRAQGGEGVPVAPQPIMIGKLRTGIAQVPPDIRVCHVFGQPAIDHKGKRTAGEYDLAFKAMLQEAKQAGSLIRFVNW